MRARPQAVVRRAVVSSLVASAGLAAAASPALAGPIVSNWMAPVSGSWATGTNWTTSPDAPNNNGGTTYNAVIDATGAAYTVTLNTSVTVDAFTLNSADALLAHTTGTFTTQTADIMNGVYRLSGGTINGGVWTIGPMGQFEVNGSGGTLTNVQMTGDIHANAVNSFVNLGGTTRFSALRLQASNADARLGNGFVLQDAIIAEGAAGGTRFLRNSSTNSTATIGATGSVTLASGVGANLNIQPAFGTFGLTNDGLIRAEAAGRTLTIGTNAFTNNGMMEVANGALTIGATNWTNAGTIAVSGGTLNLDGGWNTSAGIGTFDRTGGTINLAAAVNNAGNSFTLDNSTGSWNLNGGSITGGTVNTADGSTLVATANGGTLADVDFNGELVAAATNAFINLGGTTRFDAYRLQGANADARLGNGYVLQDAVIAEGAAGSNRFLRNASTNSTATIGATGSVTLASGAGGNLGIQPALGTFGLTNDGLIRAEAAGRTLTIGTNAFVNNGTLRANAGTLEVDAGGSAAWVNNGDAIAGPGGTLRFVDGYDTAGSTGDLRVEIAGALAANYGRINITGPTTINGSDIGLDFLGGFSPDWGDKFTILTFDSGEVTGDFSSFVLPMLSDTVNLRWFTEVTSTSVSVGVRHTSDINRDNMINFADLNIIVSNFNGPGDPTMGDVNEDGFVGFPDLNRVLSFFNTSAPVNVVPAPGAAVLALAGLAAMSRRRR